MQPDKPEKLSAGAVVVRHDGSQWQYLLLRVYHHWDFPKGVLETHEDPMHGATREIQEETGLTDVEFSWGHAFIDTGPYNRGKTARYFLAQTKTINVELPINPEIGRPEHHEHRWMNVERARQKISPRLAPVLEWAHDRLKQA